MVMMAMMIDAAVAAADAAVVEVCRLHTFCWSTLRWFSMERMSGYSLVANAYSLHALRASRSVICGENGQTSGKKRRGDVLAGKASTTERRARTRD